MPYYIHSYVAYKNYIATSMKIVTDFIQLSSYSYCTSTVYKSFIYKTTAKYVAIYIYIYTYIYNHVWQKIGYNYGSNVITYICMSSGCLSTHTNTATGEKQDKENDDGYVIGRVDQDHLYLDG